MWELYEGRYGCSVPHALLLELAEEFGVSMDLPGFEQRLQQEKVGFCVAEFVFCHTSQFKDTTLIKRN